MSDYSKEPVVITEKTSDISVGDKVKITQYYLNNYVGMQHLKDVEAEVIQITTRTIRAEALNKDEKPLYVNRYGKLPVYNIIGLFVRYPGDNALYMGSPFGFDK